MILRKPYAFFIKYFRVINLIMAVLMCFLVYRSFKIGSFLSDYLTDYSKASTDFNLSNYINIYSFILVLVVIILITSVLSVLFIKKKPKKLYIIFHKNIDKSTKNSPSLSRPASRVYSATINRRRK